MKSERLFRTGFRLMQEYQDNLSARALFFFGRGGISD